MVLLERRWISSIIIFLHFIHNSYPLNEATLCTSQYHGYMKRLFFALLVLTVWTGCAKNSVTDVSTTDCATVTGATFNTNSGQMYSMISSHCSGSSCHSAGGSESGRFLVSTNYSAILPYLSNASRSVLNGTMPRGNSFSTAELQQWQCWTNNNFPQ